MRTIKKIIQNQDFPIRQGIRKMPHTSTGTIRYRPYIDGLRGLAVIAVVLYHARLLGVHGGFVGVDVFFVISGFLITSIILRDLDAGTFSLIGFWERRVRRIIPALFIVMACTSVAAYFLILYPPDYHHLGNAIIAQSVFASNILFLLTDNYFDKLSRYSPLLHTWSLSVEEQFYILFPIIVLLCMWAVRRSGLLSRFNLSERHAIRAEVSQWNRRRLLLAVVATLGALSFLANIWLVDIQPGSGFSVPFLPSGIFWQTSYATAGFYLLLSRAWELALGILIALWAVKIRSKVLAEIMGLAGAGALVYSIFLFTDTTSFPGFAALAPTLGAGALIVANESYSTKTGIILSNSALVWTGLISYSLYLWHWPLFVFARTLFPAASAAWPIVGLIGLSVLIAWLSYRFVETPVRRKILFATRTRVFLAGLAAMSILALAGFFIQHTAFTRESGIPPAAKAVVLTANEEDQGGGACFKIPGDVSRYGELCGLGDKSGSAKPAFVVWGDSHSDALAPLLNALGQKYGMQGVAFNGGGCIPVLGVRQAPPVASCEKQNQRALQYVRDNDIKNIFLVARWSYYVMGGPDGLRAAMITDSDRISRSPEEAARAFQRNLAATVRMLGQEGRNVYIIKQVPEQFDFDTRAAFYRAVRTGQDAGLNAVIAKDNETYQALADAAIDTLASEARIIIIDPATVLCEKNGVCALEKDGMLLYRDENHLSVEGAMTLQQLFAPVFVNARLIGE